ncbi:ABC transporter ATP-binding protein [Plantactinospora sp. KBS50]|uniref:ABC transporter ATP-binding protein n=1 Tax=Plantactinospora sp. KBS50 TaxID=2024580 RepID=UPI000BAAA3CD|nr:ABC transporter ATP-binding protein [Plantactinospora sp. KBS50]ASW54397.1 ABC transporter ATP-binding protein [Plantactinospora sp. KBS50]
MLTVDRLVAGYAGGIALHEVSLTVATGTVQAVVGRNGAGKSTLVHAIAGLLPPYSGRIDLDGAQLAGLPAHRAARAGIGLVPQGRRVFPRLTVTEHLTLAASSARGRRRGSGGWTVPRVLDLLPRLAERGRHRGDQLSGGEQQMLAIARALLTQPRVLLLDEPCEGLAPGLAARIRELVAELAGTGLTVLLVEQQLHHAVQVADRVAVLEYGRLVYDHPAAEVRVDLAPVEAMLSLGTDRPEAGGDPTSDGSSPAAAAGAGAEHPARPFPRR